MNKEILIGRGLKNDDLSTVIDALANGSYWTMILIRSEYSPGPHR